MGDVDVKSLMSAARPADNILIQPHDVITVPEADVVYVIGEVRKPGAFVLNDRASVSVLQALSMAEGLGSTPAPQDSRILRSVPGNTERKQIPVDLKKVLVGKAEEQADAPRPRLPTKRRGRGEAPPEGEYHPRERGLRDVPYRARPHRVLDGHQARQLGRRL